MEVEFLVGEGEGVCVEVGEVEGGLEVDFAVVVHVVVVVVVERVECLVCVWE